MRKNYTSFFKVSVVAAFASACSISTAQNLVPNPSFDVQDSCPAVSELFVCQPWNTPTIGTPDAFNSTCPTQNGAGRTGVGSAGIYCFSTFPDNREYMKAPLVSPLVAGTTYYVSFWVKRSNFRYAISRIGAYFSTTDVNQSTTGVLNFTPQVDNPSSNYITSTSAWTNVTGSFVASGGESYILLGNFHNDANTDTIVSTSSSTSKVAYYKIDDVSVTASAVGIGENLVGGNISVYPNPASDVVSIKLEEYVSAKAITISNSIGQVVKSLNGTQQTKLIEVPVSDLAHGVYSINILTSHGLVTKKVVIAD